MSTHYAPRILELLKQLQYPGAEHYEERDIEILAQEPTVKAVFVKFASLHPSQFLSKEQLDVLRLASELNDPGFLPLDPAEINRQTKELRKTERERKRLSMQERHRREELKHTEKIVNLLEQDESLRDAVRQKRVRMSGALETQIKEAEASLKASQQDLQASSSRFGVEAQQTLREMKLHVEKIKAPGGLRSLLETETYIAVANEFVATFGNICNINSHRGDLPQQHAIRIGTKQISLIKVLQSLLDEVESARETILSSLRPRRQESSIFSKLSEALDSYVMHLKRLIDVSINQLSDSTTVVNKGQLEKLLSISQQLEVVTFAWRSTLLEESKLLRETLDTLRAVHEWEQAVFPTTTDLSRTSFMRSTFQSNTMMLDDTTFTPNPGLSSSRFEHHSQTQSLMNSTSHQKSILTAVENRGTLYSSRYFEDIINSLAGDCILFENITDQFQADRSMLCGTSGIQFLSQSDRSQLMALSRRTNRKIEELKKLIRTHDAFFRDARTQNEAHYKRMLIPLFILDRQRYEETLKTIGLTVDIFQR